MRLSGQFTVPQVFFNSKYVGNCSKLKTMDRCGKLEGKLEDLGKTLFSNDFPPRPACTLYKLTERLVSVGLVLLALSFVARTWWSTH